jgi:hypothetical protein
MQGNKRSRAAMQKSAGSPTRKAKPEPSATPAMYVAEYIGSGNVLIDSDQQRVTLSVVSSVDKEVR